MLLSDKYSPRKTKEYIVNGYLSELLQTIAKDSSIPHIVMYGPPGSGKKTLANGFLEQIFGKEVNNMKSTIYKVNGSGNKTEDVEIRHSQNHIVIEPDNNGHDKYIIQDIIKSYLSGGTINFSKSKKFKVVFINNVDYLSYNAQASLRRTIEIYSSTCRFIMVCTALSKIIEPLKSRCFCFRIPNPLKSDLFKLVLTVSAYEKINLTIPEIKDIVNKSNRNLKELYWLLEMKKQKCDGLLSSDIIISEIVVDIFSVTKDKEVDVIEILSINRDKIYNLLITNITLTEIITMITNNILNYLKNNEIDNRDKYIYTTISLATKYEHRGIYGRKEINHLEGFFVSLIQQYYLIKFGKKNIKD